MQSATVLYHMSRRHSIDYTICLVGTVLIILYVLQVLYWLFLLIILHELSRFGEF